MGSWGFWDWIGCGGVVIAAVVIAIDTAIAQSDEIKKHVPRILKIKFMGFVPLIAILISTAAFTFDELRPIDFSLPEDAHRGSPFALIQAWGADNGVFYAIIKSDSLVKDKILNRVFLIMRVPFSDRDTMTDTSIVKSQAYTITGGFMTLAIPEVNATGLRVLKDRPTPLSYTLVEVPSLFSPDQIRSLSDVEKLGGKILAGTQLSAQFVVPTAPTNPPAECPPSPASPASPAGTSPR